jgi:hypothetical protein
MATVETKTVKNVMVTLSMEEAAHLAELLMSAQIAWFYKVGREISDQCPDPVYPLSSADIEAIFMPDAHLGIVKKV